MYALGSIGVSALQSFIGSSSERKQAQTQNYLQKAQIYQQQGREYAQLTNSLKQVGRQNEAIVQAETYNYANLLDNVGALNLRDAQLKQMMSRNKVKLRTDGMSSKASMVAQSSAVGAVGASVNAMQRDVDKKLGDALGDLSQQRQIQSYDNARQQQAMWTSFYQNQVKIDDSEIDEAFLPQEPIDIGSASGGGRGGFLNHLIGAGLDFSMQHMMKSFALGLNEPNNKVPALNLISQPMRDNGVYFREYPSKSQSYGYR